MREEPCTILAESVAVAARRIYGLTLENGKQTAKNAFAETSKGSALGRVKDGAEICRECALYIALFS